VIALIAGGTQPAFDGISRCKIVGVCILSAFPNPKPHRSALTALRTIAYATNRKVGRRKHSLRPQANLYDNLPAPLRYVHHSLETTMSCDTSKPFRLRTALCVVLALAANTWLWSGPAGAAPAPASNAEEIDEVVVAPVIVDGLTVLRVRGIASFPAEKRADLIAARIRALAEDRRFSESALRTEEAGNATRILAGEQLVLTITEADAQLERLDRHTLAGATLARIGEAIRDYRRDRGAESLARSGLFALAATVALALLLWIGTRAKRRLDAFLEQRIKGRLAGLEAKSLRIVNAAQLWRMLHGLRSLLWTGTVLMAIVLYLNFLLQLFPWTRWFGLRLFALLMDPLRTLGQGLLAAIPDLVILAILVVAFRYVLKALRLLFAALAEGSLAPHGFERDWAWPTYRLVRLLVLALAVVVAYPYIPGSDSEAFKGVSILLGVIFSLGSSSVIGNVIAGYTMTYRRAFHVGDRVRINEHLGDVVEMRLLVTHVRTPKNEEIVIPNSLILNSSVVNYSTLAREGRLILYTTVGIGYETPWRQVEAMLLQAAERTAGLLKEPKPFVLQKALGDYAVTYEINVYCGDAQAMYPLYTQLHRNILDVFNEYGVQIMTPSYVADPGQPKIVPKDQWYAAPAPVKAPR
jgi:small-conductance mechanosensitive channel